VPGDRSLIPLAFSGSFGLWRADGACAPLGPRERPTIEVAVRTLFRRARTASSGRRRFGVHPHPVPLPRGRGGAGRGDAGLVAADLEPSPRSAAWSRGRDHRSRAIIANLG